MKKIVLWGAGKVLLEVIDDIDFTRCSIDFIIDSDIEKDGILVMGIPVVHYSKVRFELIETLIITTKFFREVYSVLEELLGSGKRPKIFRNVDSFMANEYVDVYNPLIKDNILYNILKKNDFEIDTDKRLQYLEVYDKYFSMYRGREITFMEIGVFNGASLKLWKEYFGERVHIIGVDINDECKKYEEDNISIEIGSQSSNFFWEYIKGKYPKIDIILDDGGHTMKQQITTLKQMFSHLSKNGIFMCEDVFTSYWKNWGGGNGKKIIHLLNIQRK